MIVSANTRPPPVLQGFKSVLLFGSGLILLSGLPSLAQAQVQDEVPADGQTPDTAGAPASEAEASSDARRSFSPDDFARFAPRNALDMARQVPGFSIQEGDGSRGLGQADTNVIINGRRISGKSNGPIDALGRIPAEEVVRLELVDGAGLDIGGLSGQVLNVITHSTGAITGQFRYSPQIRSRGTPARLLNGEVSIAGGGEKDEWTLAFENDSQRRGNDGIEQVFDGTGALIDTRDEKANFNFERLILSGSYARVADNGNVLNLTGEVQGFLFRSTESSIRSGTINPLDRDRFLENTEDEFNFEVGGDYEFGLGGGKLKLIALHRFENSPITNTVQTNFEDGSPPQGSVFDRVADEFESIARAEFSFAGLGGNLVFAAEGVRNILEQEASLLVRDNQGILQPEELPGSSARVDEDRAEVSVTYSRPLASNLQFQSSLGGEYSKLNQSGEFGLTRTFYRPKGFVSLDWNAKDNLNLSARIAREVGQLNFFDFLSRVNLDQGNANGSNANLVPQQSWEIDLEVNWTWDDLGSINIRPIYRRITDIVDQIPLEDGGQAPGNIPSADRYGLDTNLTLLSEGIGWQGTRLDVEIGLRGSSVADPFTGESRELSDRRQFEFVTDLRHDFAGSDWAIGSFISYEEFSANVRADEINQVSESFTFATAYIENKDIEGLTLRLTVGNVFNRNERFDRTVFIDRPAGTVDFVESRDRTFGTVFTLDIDGSF